MRTRLIRQVLIAAVVLVLVYVFGDAHVSAATLLLLEGFDHLAAGDATQWQSKGWSTSGNTVAGRFSGLAWAESGNGTRITKTFPAASTIICGQAFWSRFISGDIVFSMGAGANDNVLRMTFDGTGHMQIRNGSNTVIATGTTIFLSSTWYYLEVKCFVNGASGSVTVKLNGATEIAATTGNFGSSNIDRITLGDNNDRNQADDVYVCDTAGSAPCNDFLGEVRVATVMPTGDGAHSQWTPSTGTAHAALVDEATPNSDTDYVSDATPGDLDTYVFADIDGGATVYGVQVSLWARKDDAALRQIAPVVRQAGTDYVGGTDTLGSSYQYYPHLYALDPTGAAWTAANVNSDEYGVKEIA